MSLRKLSIFVHTFLSVVSLPAMGPVCKLYGHKGSINDLQFGPQREDYLASASQDGSILLWDVRTAKKPVGELRLDAFPFNVQWSPDGVKIHSFYSDNIARSWDLRSGSAIPYHLNRTIQHPYAVWAPDGTKFALCHHTGGYFGYSIDILQPTPVEGGSPTTVLQSPSFVQRTLRWDPKSKRVAIITDSGNERQVSVADGSLQGFRAYLSSNQDLTCALAWHPSNKLTVVSGSPLVDSQDECFVLTLTQDEIEPAHLKVSDKDCDCMAWTRGDTLAFNNQDDHLITLVRIAIAASGAAMGKSSCTAS